MSNPIDLRWITRCQLELIGITGEFYITEERPLAGHTIHKLRIRNSKDRFLYELHGGDEIVWQRILKEHAEAVARWYFPQGLPSKNQQW